jgi:UDP-N-acetylmuramoyl-tripeptide--D-alanyl-D-alanine ligase
MSEREPGFAYRLLRGRASATRAGSRLLAPLLLGLLGLARRGPWRGARVVAVIGSHGKTTTTHATLAALGLPVTWWSRTGRNAWSSVPLNAIWQLARSRRAVLEVGIGSPGQMARYAWALRPDLVILTGLGSDHLPSFRDLEHLWEEKGRMIAALRAGGVVVFDADDANAVAAAQSPAAARRVGFGFGEAADVRGVHWRADPAGGSRLSVSLGERSLEVRSRLATATACRALLAGLAAALVESHDLEGAVGRLSGVAPVAGRLQPRPLPGGAVVIDDSYKASLETVLAALADFAELPARRRLLLMGELETPPDGRHSYRQVGRALAGGIDRILLVGVGSKRAQAYRAAARAAGLPSERIETLADVEEAIRRLRGELAEGDLLLVEGRADQRLERVVEGLAGVEVSCRLRSCRLDLLPCGRCPLL